MFKVLIVIIFFALYSQSFGDYFRENHARLLNVWNAVGAFRCQFDSLKSATERDLSQLKSHFVQMSQNARSACLDLNTNVHKFETQNAVSKFQIMSYEISK